MYLLVPDAGPSVQLFSQLLQTAIHCKRADKAYTRLLECTYRQVYAQFRRTN